MQAALQAAAHAAAAAQALTAGQRGDQQQATSLPECSHQQSQLQQTTADAVVSVQPLAISILATASA